MAMQYSEDISMNKEKILSFKPCSRYSASNFKEKRKTSPAILTMLKKY